MPRIARAKSQKRLAELADGVLVQRSLTAGGTLRELWRADDATFELELLGDISDVDASHWAWDVDRLLVAAGSTVAQLDARSIALTPLFDSGATYSGGVDFTTVKRIERE